MNMGNVYESMKENDLAIQTMRKAIELKPENPNAHFNLGVIYLKNNDLKNARIQFARVIDLDPDDLEAQKALNATMKYK